MPFCKVIKKTKGTPYKVGEIVLVEDEEVRDGYSLTTDGVELETKNIKELTEEERKACLEETVIQL